MNNLGFQPNPQLFWWGQIEMVSGWLHDDNGVVRFFDHPLTENELWCASATRAIQCLRYIDYNMFQIIPQPTSCFHYMGLDLGLVFEAVRNPDGTLGANMLPLPITQRQLDLFNDAKRRYRAIFEDRYGPRSRKFDHHRKG